DGPGGVGRGDVGQQGTRMVLAATGEQLAFCDYRCELCRFARSVRSGEITGELRIGEAVDRGNRPGHPARVEAHDVEPGPDGRGDLATGLEGVLDTGRAGATRVDHQ